MKNNHLIDTEYKGGEISPPPNKVDLQKISDILNKARAIGYIGINKIPLLPKTKDKPFEPIALCLPQVTSLLKALGLKVFEGNKSSKKNNKNLDKKDNKKENITKCVENMTKMTTNVGQFGSGLSSDISPNIRDTIADITSRFVNTNSDTGKEIAATVYNNISSNTNNTNMSSTNLIDFAKMDFINFDAIDLSGKKMSEKLSDYLQNSRTVITRAGIDRDVQESNEDILDFKQKFDDIKTKLLDNLEKYPNKLIGQISSSYDMIDITQFKTDLAKQQLDNKIPIPFGGKIEDIPVLPEDWKPSYE